MPEPYVPPEVMRLFEGTVKSQVGDIHRATACFAYPELEAEVPVTCRECSELPETYKLVEIVVQLNDWHHYAFEQIARVVENPPPRVFYFHDSSFGPSWVRHKIDLNRL